MKAVSYSRGLETDQIGSSDDLARGKPTWGSDFWWVLAVGLIAVALCLPFTLYVFWLPDEGVMLHGAERMLRGDRIYLDFFEFLPPGSFAITAAWFKIAGISLLSARALAIATAAGIACFTYLACRQASKHAPTSAFIAVGWVVLTQGYWTEVIHQWFTTLFAIVATWATLVVIEHPPRRLRWPLTAGIAAGAAVMVTTNRGALTMLAAATPFADMRRYWRELIIYLLGAALFPTCVFAYLVWQGALSEAFEDVILFTAQHYSTTALVHWGFESIFPLKWLFPLVALVTLLTFILGWPGCLRDRVLRTCVAFALAAFIGCFPRPDKGHLSYAVASVCPLLAYCTRRLTGHWLPKYQYVVVAAAAIYLSPAGPVYARWAGRALHADIVATPRGPVMFVPMLDPVSGRELAARIAATPPGDAYFFYPHDAMLPFLTGRRQVSRYDLLAPEYTLPSQYQEACVSVMHNASWVVIDRDWTSARWLTAVFPHMTDSKPPETKKFEQALETGFELVAVAGKFELRRRVPAIDDAVCAGIAG